MIASFLMNIKQITDNIHEDASITGTSIDKRPGLQAATAEGLALVAYSISRILTHRPLDH